MSPYRSDCNFKRQPKVFFLSQISVRSLRDRKLLISCIFLFVLCQAFSLWGFFLKNKKPSLLIVCTLKFLLQIILYLRVFKDSQIFQHIARFSPFVFLFWLGAFCFLTPEKCSFRKAFLGCRKFLLIVKDINIQPICPWLDRKRLMSFTINLLNFLPRKSLQIFVAQEPNTFYALPQGSWQTVRQRYSTLRASELGPPLNGH